VGIAERIGVFIDERKFKARVTCRDGATVKLTPASLGRPNQSLDANQIKKPRGKPRGFYLIIVEEDIPSFADLAATYSSKP
jgi:hypothetical protein